MTTGAPNNHDGEVDVFSRGSLKFTFELIRKKNPQLALTIRNITGGDPLPKSAENVDNKHSDYFRVDLDSHQIRAIVEHLMEYTAAETTDSSNPGLPIIARTLTQDWLALAQKMMDELSEDQGSTST